MRRGDFLATLANRDCHGCEHLSRGTLPPRSGRAFSSPYASLKPHFPGRIPCSRILQGARSSASLCRAFVCKPLPRQREQPARKLNTFLTVDRLANRTLKNTRTRDDNPFIVVKLKNSWLRNGRWKGFRGRQLQPLLQCPPEIRVGYANQRLFPLAQAQAAQVCYTVLGHHVVHVCARRRHDGPLAEMGHDP